MRAVLLIVALLPNVQPADKRATTGPVISDVDRLIARLSFQDPAVRESAAKQILQMQRAARPKVLDAAEHSPDPQIRAAAQEILLQLPWTAPEDPPGVVAILANYGQPQVFHRVAAIRSLAANQAQHAPGVLLRLLREDPSDEIRWLIVTTLRGPAFGRDKLPALEQIDTSSKRSPNLALAGWVWERSDYPRAMELYWQALELEAAQPSVDPSNHADFLFDSLVAIELWNKRPDRAAQVLRVQYARRPESVDREDEVSNKLDELFGLHASFGPLAGFSNDVFVHAAQLARAQVMYAAGRMYHRRTNQLFLADALYRAAYASNLGPPGDRTAVSEFLTNQHWNDLAESELRTIAAAETNPQSLDYANAHLRLGLVLARRGDDAGAAKHKELAMQALGSMGGKVTRVKGDRRIEDQAANEYIWGEIHWHYFRAAKAKDDKVEMEKRTAALLELLPEDEHVVLDVAPALLERGRREEAARLFVKPYAALKQHLKDKPNDPERLNNLAWLCARCDQQLEEADGHIEKALKARPDNYAYLDTAAEVKFKLGRVDEAIRLEERALELKPDDEFIISQLKRFREAKK